MTLLAVPLIGFRPDQVERFFARVRTLGADLVELRLDYFEELTANDVAGLITEAHRAGLRVLATCRSRREGGRFSGTDAAYLDTLEATSSSGADYIDIEWESIREDKTPIRTFLERNREKAVLSCHDFTRCPDDLAAIVDEMKEWRPAVCKIAYMPQKITDCFGALDLIHHDNVLAMAMGGTGVMTRLLARKLGAFLTFAGLESGAESAPGQISLADMKNCYRWDGINAQTQVFGVIGSPVGHSLSPGLHNAAFEETSFDGLYIPLLVDPDYETFAGFLDGLRQRPWLDMRGLSVTIPHKENALRYVRENAGRVDPLAEKIGAVNTILFQENNTLYGTNTDYAGAMGPIRERLNASGRSLQDIRTAVLGAGGAARAIVAGLTDAGCAVTIYNRTASKAQRLAETFSCQWADWKKLGTLKADLIVNCTSIGMHPHIDASPLPSETLRSNMVIFDTVYNPLETLLLRYARQTGAQAIDGVTMFVTQAAAQFHLFTGREAPAQRMRELVQAKFNSPH